jgi:hypothetical protein
MFIEGYDIQVRIASISVDAGQMDRVKVQMVPALIDGTVIIPVSSTFQAVPQAGLQVTPTVPEDQITVIPEATE